MKWSGCWWSKEQHNYEITIFLLKFFPLHNYILSRTHKRRKLRSLGSIRSDVRRVRRYALAEILRRLSNPIVLIAGLPVYGETQWTWAKGLLMCIEKNVSHKYFIQLLLFCIQNTTQTANQITQKWMKYIHHSQLQL